MELVDANTKNYLFLTMNQYNEQNKLVRARVTMRRDQAFWEGGNSFIACESFRISSAPSQGGLYYKILPDTFYLGSLNREPIADDPVVWEALVKSANPPDFPGYTLFSPYIGNGAVAVGAVLHVAAEMGVSALPQEATAIPYAHPNAVLPIVGQMWTDHSIQKGEKIKLICYNAGNPAELLCTVVNDPMNNVSGRGAGPDNMFYPVTGSFIKGANSTQDLVAGNQTQLSIKNLGHADLKPNVDLIKAMTRMLGAGNHALGTKANLQIAVGPNGAYDTIPNPLKNVGLEFWGPSGIEVDGIDLWNQDANGDNTTLKHKLYWDTDDLRVGSTVYIIAPADVGPPAVAAHKQYGVVTAINDFITTYHVTGNDGPVRGVSINGGMWTLSTSYLNYFAWGSATGGPGAWGNVTGHNALNHMMEPAFPWVLTTGNQHIPKDIIVTLHAHVDATNTGAALNGFHAALPITQFDVQKGDNRKLTRIERRACDRGETKYVYTPNELYYTFNNPQGGFNVDGTATENTPYTLQTHENGGFKVVWDGKFSDFYMSVAMHEALGLNTYFEYNHILDGYHESYWELALQQQVADMEIWDQSLNTTIVHIPASDVYQNGVDPLTPVNASTIALGDLCMVADGTTYVLVSKELITDQTQNNEVVKQYPITTFDDFGDRVYTWKNLPAAVMGNSQQVSVESFGTFSGINIVIPNLPFQPMLGTQSDDRILASLRLPFQYGTENNTSGIVNMTDFSYYGDLLFNSDSSRSYLRITTDQQLYDCDVEARLIRRDGGMEVLYLPYLGQFEIKLRFLQTQ